MTSSDDPTRPRPSKAILFADISDSSRLVSTLGDDDARRVVHGILDRLGSIVGATGGRVVDRIGDELMCAFASADGALEAAFQIQRAVEVDDATDAGVSVRVGLHFGPVSDENGTLFGETIYVAKRLVDEAKGGQIVLARETLERLAEEDRPPTRLLDRTTVKGRPQALDVLEVLWGVDATHELEGGSPRDPNKPFPELLLEYGSHSVRLCVDRPSVNIGRQARCDVVVDHPSVSRLHARLELKKDTFVFVDLSTNGSELRLDGSEPRRLRRDSARLSGSGTIILGPGGADAVEHPLRFRVISSS